MRWLDFYEWVDSCKWVDPYTMKCEGRPSPGAWYLQIPAQGLAPGKAAPRVPHFGLQSRIPGDSARGLGPGEGMGGSKIKTKKKRSQNEVLYRGKCLHIL